MTSASHPSTHQNPECKSGAYSPALRQAVFSTDSTRRLVVGYVSFDSRLVVGWWSVTCRLVVDWWSVTGRFQNAPSAVNPCQSSPPSQKAPSNSIATTDNPPKQNTIPQPTSPVLTPSPRSSVSIVASVALPPFNDSMHRWANGHLHPTPRPMRPPPPHTKTSKESRGDWRRTPRLAA